VPGAVRAGQDTTTASTVSVWSDDDTTNLVRVGGFRFAVVLRPAGIAPLVALRHTKDVTEEVSQWALGVADRAELTRWAAHFDGHGVVHSDVMPARAGHVMTCLTPGGPALLLYADEADDAAVGPATS
jgi:hypothetical protein